MQTFWPQYCCFEGKIKKVQYFVKRKPTEFADMMREGKLIELKILKLLIGWVMIPLSKTGSMKMEQDYWEDDDEFSFVELDWIADETFKLGCPMWGEDWVCSASETDSLWA